MNKHITQLLALALGITLALPAMAAPGDNTNYGETRWNKLPTRGMVSKNIWVGSWWSYQLDGLAYRIHDSSATNYGSRPNYAGQFDRFDNKDVAKLSPSEKFDTLVGRADKIDYDAIIAHARKNREFDSSMKSKIDERRDLVRTLNKLIETKRGESGFRWQDTDDGKRYMTLQEEISEIESQVSKDAIDVDTATEYEILNHGSSQFGVGSWFGHCNAWAAAAILEPEPRQAVTVDGIEFTPADVKSFLTENYMEVQSSFHGSRNNAHEEEADREDVSYQDVTASTFHILFADQVGNRDKSFVIDRYTGDQVWNQPVKAFRAKCEALYEDDKAVDRTLKATVYDYYKGNRVEDMGTKQVFPVVCTTTMHWVTDGLPAETLTLDVSDDIDDETFADSRDMHDLYKGQIEIRTLTYELWLDKPMSDANARIIGDGVWQHGGSLGYDERHPDFIWQPTANVNNSSRDYENEYIDSRVVNARILPGSLEAKDDPTVSPGSWSTTGDKADIPDEDKDQGASLSLSIDDDVVVNTMTIDVDITHTYIGDLEVRLVAPDARSTVLKAFGVGRGDDDIKKTYDVKDFNGASAKGTWTLEVRDQWADDTGSINAFTLHIK